PTDTTSVQVGCPLNEGNLTLAMDSDGNTAVNGRFILVKSRQDGEYCATLYGDYLEDRPSPEMDARHDEAARYFRSIG
ncbi:hypothetical protein R3J22_09065, partial [Trueperella bernardiae]|uniref:hypothetical protein n=1 Tax=Trueperella bernardiae TaxID=59561 RepID=UPI002949601D